HGAQIGARAGRRRGGRRDEDSIVEIAMRDAEGAAPAMKRTVPVIAVVEVAEAQAVARPIGIGPVKAIAIRPVIVGCVGVAVGLVARHSNSPPWTRGSPPVRRRRAGARQEPDTWG